MNTTRIFTADHSSVIRIPPELGLYPGDEVEIIEHGDAWLIRKPSHNLLATFNVLASRPEELRHEFNVTTAIAFQGMNEVVKLLAKLPSPEEILALHPSETLQNKIQGLLEKSRTNGLTTEEEQQWQQYEYLEHLVRLAKTHAILKLQR